jgi:hypothetical protein
MRHLVVLFSAATLSLVGGVIATSAAASGSTATTEPSSAATEAPAATEAAAPSSAAHPLVGAWLMEHGNTTYVASFDSDGTYQQVDSGNGQIGVWEATGPNSGLVTSIAVVSEADGGGLAKFRATFEVSADGQSVAIDWEGALLREGAPVALGPGTDTGVRVNVEQMGAPWESETSVPTTSD